jgi:16S rRNA (cytosine967-C5)-methyltransferase
MNRAALPEPQALAALALAEVLAGHSLNQVLPEVWRRHPQLSSQVRGATQDLVYGTLRHLARMESYLQALTAKPTPDEQVRCLLLVALYQLAYAKTPEHAAVNQTVDAARSLKKDWAAGFVNGVLRNFLRRKDELAAKAERRDTTRFSYPRWWIDKLRLQYPAQYRQLLETSLGHPPMTLRVNVRKTSRADYEALLRAAGVGFSVVGPVALQLDAPVAVDKLPNFREGWVSVQDAGAQAATGLLDLRPGLRVLDVCSAPGGKTAHMLETADVELLAVDKDEARLARVRENLQRLGLAAQVKLGDAADPNPWWDGRPFQRILADVPCSASGVVRRHPDIKWLRRPEDIVTFAREQTRILNALWRLLEVGGKLLYATCSVFAEENQKVVETFLVEHPDAERLPLPQFDDGFTQLLPDATHDGFFYALLAKRGG